MKTLCFSVFSAISGAYLTVPARLQSGPVEPSVDDLKKPLLGFPQTSLTSLKAFQAQELSYIFKSFDGNPAVYYRVIDCLTSCTAIVIKTCTQMEGPYVDFMKTRFQKKFLLSGPLTPEPQLGALEQKWADWLGQHPPKSVIFCSFGSKTFRNKDQIKELATGLELTGLPFFLVLNFPAGVNGQAELEQALPKRFMEAIKGRGVIHTGWVQQQLILAHQSVGCYVCHSGYLLLND
ncbi:UDP-glucuronosyl/UDP-glucosyltransferase [Corchorus olitorius]|uniref:UDP-glucuronosyl/UDP-glucosyltransferase n=1 Tax=Corchorus olitorius TaxID=93759 RepID=A0A1R3KM88_9ROSI|nr:UDP-glucuronosyl/UDP-glucosyltransferase [Corchorus olitorius]